MQRHQIRKMQVSYQSNIRHSKIMNSTTNFDYLYIPMRQLMVR